VSAALLDHIKTMLIQTDRPTEPGENLQRGVQVL